MTRVRIELHLTHAQIKAIEAALRWKIQEDGMTDADTRPEKNALEKFSAAVAKATGAA